MDTISQVSPENTQGAMTEATDARPHSKHAGEQSVSRGCELVQETQIWQQDRVHTT